MDTYPVTLVATVTSQNSIDNGDTVLLEDASNNNAVVASGTTTNGSVTFVISSLGYGPHNLFAFYTGDATNESGTSNTVTQTVNNPTPTLTSITPNFGLVALRRQPSP